MKSNRLILVTNDDGVQAKGLKALTDVARQFGEVVVVAPTEGQSGMAHAITVRNPIRVYRIQDSPEVKIFACNGTPVDCVKMAINRLLPRKPDLLLAGINHGANSSTSIVYSGTMAATLEGCLNQIPSIGYSLLSFDKDADFRASQHYVEKITNNVLSNGLKPGVCLNVNIPYLPQQEINGVKICRQNHGVWREEFDHRTDPNGIDYFWLTGTFEDMEPDANDTDEWALRNSFVSVVPVQFDFTAYGAINELKSWKF